MKAYGLLPSANASTGLSAIVGIFADCAVLPTAVAADTKLLASIAE